VVSSLQLRGTLDGIPVAVPILLCPILHPTLLVPQAPSVAVCTQPLFLGPGLPGHRIVEWIEYHLILGISRFYVYDRDDALGELLSYHERAGSVVRYVWPLFEPRAHAETSYYDQQNAQDHCLLRHRASHTWLAFLDPDEYISLKGEQDHRPGSMSRYLQRLDEDGPTRHASQVMMQNVLMAGTPVPGASLLVAQFVMSAGVTVPWRQKPLLHSASTKFVWAHFASRLHCGSTVMANPSTLVVLHFMGAEGRTLSDATPTILDQSATWIVPHLQARMNQLRDFNISTAI